MADLFWAARHRWRRAYARRRHSWDGRVPATLLLVALALGLVLGLLLGRWVEPDGSRTPPERDRAQLSEGRHRGPEAHSQRGRRPGSTDLRLGRCEEAYTAQVRPLRAIRPALAQWEVHIGAMNKLVVGTISLAQAQEFWSRTRERAARDLAEFEDSQRGFDQRTARCPMPGERASDQLRRCAAVVAARHRELDRAAVALATWRTHFRHMEMLRRGEMTPGEATLMWLESWREGSRQMDAYRSAARRAQSVADSQRHLDGGADGPCAG